MNDKPNGRDSIQVVVVEDGEDDALMTLRAISKLRPSVIVELVSDGEEALELMLGPNACRPLLIFLDLKLPKVNGLEILRRLRLDPRTHQTPVVMLSSADEPNAIAQSLALGANEYLRKPMELAEYERLVCEAASKHLSASLCSD